MLLQYNVVMYDMQLLPNPRLNIMAPVPWCVVQITVAVAASEATVKTAWKC